VATHSLQLEPGFYPHKYTTLLPVSQGEVDRQVKQPLEKAIIAISDSPWNSTLLVIRKKADPDWKSKWRLVVDFRKVNDKSVGIPTRYLISPKY
jgi:hypothetical protein